MITYHLFIIIVYTQEVYAKAPPNYVHLHTMEEIDETNYVVLDKLNVCKDAPNVNDRLFLAIKSSPVNLEQRNILRQTWLTEVREHQIPYLFILGVTTNQTHFDDLLVEDKSYNDLLIGKPIDDYYNLTLKGMFLFKWTMTFCPTQWLLYVDDDSIVNAQQVIDFMGSVENVSARAIYCTPFIRRKVHRDRQSKFFIEKSVWPLARYPDFCSGNGYLIPPYILPLLHDTSTNNFTEPKLWFEDVFFTGIVAKALGIELIRSPIGVNDKARHQKFNTSLVLGEMGKGIELLKNWETIRGKSIPREKWLSENVISTNQTARLDRKGHLMTTQSETDQKLFRFIRKKLSSNSIYYLIFISVTLIIILLYKLLR